MHAQALQQTINDLLQPGKGILAADESESTIGKRFANIGVENTAENRRRYRSLLATTPDLGDHINGVILFKETLTQQTDDGRSIVSAFVAQGIVPGIKVDQGLVPFATNPEEKITQGLDGLSEALVAYRQQGARFAKWRAVFTISNELPSTALIHANAELLARYSAICQANGIVPIVEPEVLMDGDNNLARCESVTTDVLHHVFNALYRYHVTLEHIVLKPNMVVPGKSSGHIMDPREVAEATLRTLRRTVPAAVPTINFLSGGQTPEQATLNLHHINSQGVQPWYLSFSFGRALQEPCQNAWRGQDKNIAAAQQALLTCARNNGAAALGEYTQ